MDMEKKFLDTLKALAESIISERLQERDAEIRRWSLRGNQRSFAYWLSQATALASSARQSKANNIFPATDTSLEPPPSKRLRSDEDTSELGLDLQSNSTANSEHTLTSPSESNSQWDSKWNNDEQVRTYGLEHNLDYHSQLNNDNLDASDFDFVSGDHDSLESASVDLSNNQNNLDPTSIQGKLAEYMESAVKAGCIESVQAMLDTGVVKANALDLKMAVKWYQPDLIGLLIEAGADADQGLAALDGIDITFFLLSIEDAESCLRQLLKGGAKPQRFIDSLPFLMFFGREEALWYLRMLLVSGLDPNDWPIHQCLKFKDLPLATEITGLLTAGILVSNILAEGARLERSQQRDFNALNAAFDVVRPVLAEFAKSENKCSFSAAEFELLTGVTDYLYSCRGDITCTNNLKIEIPKRMTELGLGFDQEAVLKRFECTKQAMASILRPYFDRIKTAAVMARNILPE